ncbi:MAG TPA: hypothetical protein VN372_03705 [Methanospirillum sp.]|nr:hypothetical protein [Methanospirillum sp.]
MSQLPMYPAKAGSPQTTTTALLTASATSVAVTELADFPDIGTEGANVASLQNGALWESCPYTAKSAASGPGTLTIARSGAAWASSTGAAQEWASGSKISRTDTAYDHDVVKSNIEEHETRIAAAEGTISSHSSSISALNTVAPLVKVSANDTTPGVLNGKLVAGTGISLTEGTDGGNETMIISSTASGSSGMNPIVASLFFG